METNHLLIIRFSAMGDVAMTVPIVASLARQYPSLKITVVSRPFAKAFYEGLDKNIEFVGVDLKKEYVGISGLNKLYRKLKAKSITQVADFHDVLRTKYLRLRFSLKGVQTAHINKHKAGKRDLCKKEHKVFIQQPSSFQNYLDVLKTLGYDIEPQHKSIFAPYGNIKPHYIYNKIEEKQENDRWIGIAPFAAHSGKMYPKEKMEEVIHNLSTLHTTWKIFLFGGGKQELDVFYEWEKRFTQCVCVASKLKGLQEELSLMSKLDVMLSMDSANMHLASLVGTRVVSVWGATHPYCGFMGWAQKQADIVQNNNLTCRPCSVFGNKPCYRGDFACMNTITPNEIIKKLEEE